MADPTKYQRGYSFSGYQSTNPSKPLPAPPLDNELENIERAIGEAVDGLKDIRRSDGKLKNNIVTADALAPDLMIGFTMRGAWAVDTSYNAADGVEYEGLFYKALFAHTSTAETAPGLSPETWAYLFEASLSIPPTGSVTNERLADGAVDDAKVAADAGIDAGKLSYLRTGATGAIRKALDVIVGLDTVNAREFVNCDGTDETFKFQAFLNAAKNKRGILPQGEIKITGVSIDPSANILLEGVGHDPNGIYTSRIRNISETGAHAIVINDAGNAGRDNFRKFEKFSLFGNRWSGDGLHLASAHGVHLEDLWISTHGGNGIYTYKGFSNKIIRCVVTQNGMWGILQDVFPNAVVLLNSAFNGNSRLDGFGNIAFKGTAGFEALNIVVVGCDFTGAGSNPYPGVVHSAAFGLLLEHVWSAKIEGNYAENVAAVPSGFLLYAGPTVRGLSFRENYMQDGRVLFDGVPELDCTSNTFFGVTAGLTTALQVINSGNNDQHIRRNILKGSAVETMTGAMHRKETYRTSPPADGTWKLGDLAWNLNPAPSQPLGWVCTTAGTPGTWKVFATIAS